MGRDTGITKNNLREGLGMPICFEKKPEIYCPVCGCKHETKFYMSTPPFNPIIKIIWELNKRYIVFTCIKCNTSLIYDTKKEMIKIKK